MSRGLPVALLAALLAGCASSSPWERTARVEGARLYVPRVFAPLVPGSIYPDRSRPVPARGLPGVLVVVRRLPAASVAEPLGRRGLVVLASVLPVDAGLERLRALPEAGGKTGLFLESPDEDLLRDALSRPEVAAAVVAGPVPALPFPHPPLLVLAVGEPRGPALEGISERWYASPSGRLPAIALFDAADWLAERLR